MSDKTTQYLLYASLLLGSVGTYHALKHGMPPALDSEASIAGALSSGDISSADLTAMLTQLSRKVDENTAAKARNSETIVSVAEDTTEIRSEVEQLAGSISAVDAFLQSFNSKSTDVHNKLADMEATLTTLTSFSGSAASAPVEVDSAYVTTLAKRVGLLETSSTSSKEAAFTARDDAQVNKGSLAKIKTSVDTLRTEFSAAKIASGQVAQLAEKLESVSPSSTAVAAMTTRLNGLTSESQRLAERLLGLEKWKEAKANDAKNVSSDSSSAEISEAMKTRLTDVEIVADTNQVNMTTLRNDVDINTDDISTFQTDLQEQISINKSAISAVDMKAYTTDDNLLNIWTPRVDSIEADVAELEAADIRVKTRITALEEAETLASAARDIITSDLAGVALRVTDAETSITDLEDDVELVVKEGIKANKDNITAMTADAAYLSEKLLRSGDDILCNGLLRANAGAEISLDSNYLRMGTSTNNGYMMYVGSGEAEKGPSGNAPAKGHGFEAFAARMRTADSDTSGFMVENASEKTLLSVRGSDGLTWCRGPLTAHDKATIFSEGTNAFFSHAKFNDNVNFALAHISSGKTILSSNGGGKSGTIECRVRGKNMVKMEASQVMVEEQLMVNHAAGTHDTYFRADNNYISTGHGKRTYFRFGDRDPTVEIRDKEVRINGTDVLAKIDDLETRLKTLEDSAVKNNAGVYLKNQNNNKYVRKADNSNDVIADQNKHAKGSRERFWIELQ